MQKNLAQMEAYKAGYEAFLCGNSADICPFDCDCEGADYDLWCEWMDGYEDADMENPCAR